MSYETQRPDNQAFRETQGKRIKTIEAPIKVEVFGVSNPITRIFDVYTPSSRLKGYVELFFALDESAAVNNGGIPMNFDDSKWSLEVRADSSPNGAQFVNYIDPVFTGTELDFALSTDGEIIPRSYEWDSGAKIIRGTALMNSPLSILNVELPGTWYVRAHWEANTFICDEELVELFNACKLIVPKVE